MNKDDLISEIKFNFGYPVVKVELDDTAWDEIIRKTLRWFRAKKGLIYCSLLSTIDGTSEYDAPSGSDKIVDVALPKSAGDDLFPGLCDLGLTSYPASFFGYSPYGPMQYDMSTYIQIQQQLEMRRRIFGADLSWQEQCGKLIFTENPGSGKALVFYKPRDIALEDIKKNRDEQLVYEYALAVSKHILGRLRSKYGTYPAAGGPISMDGEALIAEAKEDFERLEMEISESQGNAGGIVVG